MNEVIEPEGDFFRLDIHLDGNGAKPHRVIKSFSAEPLVEAAWKDTDQELYPQAIWIVWKEFAGNIITRHLVSVNPSHYNSVDEIIIRVLKRADEVDRPLPVPDNPPVTWV